MITAFFAAFSAAVAAILGIFVVIAGAGGLVRCRVVRQEHISALSAVTVTVFLPCLIFSKVTANLDPAKQPLWWAIPLVALLMSAVALAVAALVFVRELDTRRNMLPLASMQNAGFLVLPVGLSLFPQQFDTFALYCFLFILGFNPVLWSAGKLLATGGEDRGWSWRGLLTPPLVANVVAIAAVFVHAVPLIPGPVLRAVELLGRAAVPVATFILGAVLGSIPLQIRPHLADAVRVLLVKLAALPALVVLVLVQLPYGLVDPLLARFLVIEAAAAPAAGIILMVRRYGGDEVKIGSIMFACYAACAVTLPAWIAVWELVAPAN